MRFCCSLHETPCGISRATIRAEGKDDCFGRNITLRWRSRNANGHDTSRDTAFLQNPKDYVTNNAARGTFGSFYVSTSNSRAQLITALKGAFVGGPTRNIDENTKENPKSNRLLKKKKLFFDFLFLVFGRKAHKGIKGLNLCAKRQYGGKHTDPCISSAFGEFLRLSQSPALCRLFGNRVRKCKYITRVRNFWKLWDCFR